MESCVQLCPTAHVLAVMAREGWEQSRASPEARALLHAVRDGSTDAALRILDADRADDSWCFCCERSGDTAVHLAVARGCLHLTGLLLKRRALLDSRNLRGETPLHLACHHGFAEIVDLLCHSGADPRCGDLAANEA